MLQSVGKVGAYLCELRSIIKYVFARQKVRSSNEILSGGNKRLSVPRSHQI